MPKQREQRQELASKGHQELTLMLAAAREELRSLRFRIASNQHKDIREVRDVRKRIARILTILSHRPRKPEIKQ
ncbi:MAG: 50S ribosomal protein L29 [Candidatus Kerfeldbacteria bacterium]